MVAANKRLLKTIHKLAIRDELRAMRLRGRLLVPHDPPPSKKLANEPSD